MIRRLAGLMLVVTAAVTGGAAATTVPHGHAGGAVGRPVTVTALRAASVHVVGHTGRDSSWHELCTGTKILVRQAEFVLTAAHCISGADRLAIVLPDATHSLAAVTRRAVVADSDAALLEVTSLSAFHRVGGLDYLSHLSAAPRGAATSSFSFQVASPLGAETAGSYLGRFRRPDRRSVLLDFVALVGDSALTPSQDACFFGSSGSLAVVGGDHIAGPLSVRIRTTLYAGMSAPAAGDLPISGARTYVAALHMDGFGRIATLCGYAVVTREGLIDAARRLTQNGSRA